MPELPEVEAVRRRLDPAMTGARFTHVTVRRPDLRIPFPRRFAARLTGETVVALIRRAKYLAAELSSQGTLLMHLGMSGSFRVERPGAGKTRKPRAEGKHDHVVFEMSNGAVVTFTDPRRFGFMDLLTPKQLAAHPVFSTLGPEPLSDAFDGDSLALACQGKKTSLKAALLDQRVVAGLGNIYVVEALHRAGLSPMRPASILATASGKPRPSAHRLAKEIKQVLLEAIERKRNPSYRANRFRVYDREDEPCLRRGCGGRIQRRTQAGRSTFYCASCQR
ncbi:MAG TPA: bifunctional DNA-formamidopyrimidine glycosylase/DNA-(apurinic or apyrimidinic site) lyase [Vicinamibacterales bacterium]|nr:bifunctional DNA-formamidopyrimidine glycosylase/DNA-(apurinic or apyrimidinic site) lyase [Vicinamibacterales bacterium]